LDVGNPAEPAWLGTLAASSEAPRVAGNERIAYLLSSRWDPDRDTEVTAVEVIDFEGARGPTPSVETATAVDAHDVEIGSGRAYVRTPDGVEVYDLVDPLRPEPLGAFSLSNAGIISGQITYDVVRLEGDDCRLEIREISDPATPTLIGQTDAPCEGSPAGMAVYEDRLYIVRSREYWIWVYCPKCNLNGWRVPRLDSWIDVFDVSQSSAPRGACPDGACSIRIIGNLQLGLFSRASERMAPIVVNDRLYVQQYSYVNACTNCADCGPCYARKQTTTTFDLGDPDRPALIGQTALADARVVDHRVVGNQLYEAVSSGPAEAPRLRVTGLSGPTSPQWLDIPAEALALDGDRIYASSDHDIRVLDVSNPESPAVIGLYRGAAPVCGFDVAVNYMYLADGGLRTMRVNPDLEYVTTPASDTVELEVPAGFHPGLYDVVVTNPDDDSGALHNAFRLCEASSAPTLGGHCHDADVIAISEESSSDE
jgi:hypothetical protein